MAFNLTVSIEPPASPIANCLRKAERNNFRIMPDLCRTSVPLPNYYLSITESLNNPHISPHSPNGSQVQVAPCGKWCCPLFYSFLHPQHLYSLGSRFRYLSLHHYHYSHLCSIGLIKCQPNLCEAWFFNNDPRVF